MSSLKSKLDAASFRYADIPVCLNGDLSMKRDDLHRSLQAAVERASKGREASSDERLSAPNGRPAAPDNRLGQPTELEHVLEEIESVEAEMRDQIITLRFTTIDADEYELLKINAGPPRQNSTDDAIRGYNVHEVTKAAAVKSGKVVEGEKPDEQVEDITDEEWAQIWAKLSSGDFDRIKYAIVNLNETNGHAGVEYLKKGSSPIRSSGTTSS